MNKTDIIYGWIIYGWILISAYPYIMRCKQYHSSFYEYWLVRTSKKPGQSATISHTANAAIS